jgi:hypothetical protein
MESWSSAESKSWIMQSDMLAWTLDVFNCNKGAASSISNVWTGSCYLQQKDSHVLELRKASEEHTDTAGLHS